MGTTLGAPPLAFGALIGIARLLPVEPEIALNVEPRRARVAQSKNPCVDFSCGRFAVHKPMVAAHGALEQRDPISMAQSLPCRNSAKVKTE